MPFDASPQIEVDAPVGPVEMTLRRARWLIRSPVKWCQGAEHDDGQMCVMGAIKSAGVADTAEDVWAAVDFVARRVGGNIPEFNDARGRTHGEIVAMLDRCIKAARADNR